MFRLKWKIGLSTIILIILVLLGVFLPNYWQTRSSMENQLQKHLFQQIEIIENIVNEKDIKLLQEIPSNTLVNKLKIQFNNIFKVIESETVYIFDNNGIILFSVGNNENAIKSIALHFSLIDSDVTFTPVFEDKDGNFYLSVFKQISNNYYIGISAGAEYFENLAILRKQMLVIAMIVLVFSFFIAFVFSFSLTKPLQKLTDYTKHIGKGNINKFHLAKRKDEIGILYHAMQEMQKNIKNRENENKQIVASVAHELRNPIAGMQINLELLMEELEKDSSAFNFSQLTHKDILKLAEIVDSFLNYSRPIESNLESYDIASLISEIAQDYPAKISGNGVTKIHKNKMRHAISNILRNAFEETEQPVEVKISQNDYIKIEILNFGKPIEAINRSQIFEAFFSTKENGVGLGLPIAKSIVEQHGGQIKLEKSDNSGTLFVIVLPLVK